MCKLSCPNRCNKTNTHTQGSDGAVRPDFTKQNVPSCCAKGRQDRTQREPGCKHKLTQLVYSCIINVYYCCWTHAAKQQLPISAACFISLCSLKQGYQYILHRRSIPPPLSSWLDLESLSMLCVKVLSDWTLHLASEVGSICPWKRICLAPFSEINEMCNMGV